jgi:hypothetical protein
MAWQKTYDGFEDASDLHRDVSEAIEWNEGIFPEGEPAEWQGKLTVTIKYEPENAPNQSPTPKDNHSAT